MALFRAIETCRRPARRLFVDPLARGFLGGSLGLVADLSRFAGFRAGIERLIDHRWPGARTSGVARTRLIDDAVKAAASDGFQQFVILGAGFDSRAYRLPAVASARVFEVDHPTTLALKRERLGAALGSLPDHVRFVAVDLDRGELREALLCAGFEPSVRSFFLWEGVTNYLSPGAVDSTLRSLSAVGAPSSRILFTYVHRGLLDGSQEFAGTEHLFATLERSGEPWLFGLEPGALPAYLNERGLELMWDLGAQAYRARYMGPAASRLAGYEFYRAALAEVRNRVAPCSPSPPGTEASERV
jgi:methyltransferase (TIGR00027 family)